MGAADRFKGANTKFNDRGEYLIPIQREETVDVVVNGVVTGKTTKLVYDSPANYELKIKRCIWKTARAPKKGEFYIVEAEVTKSNNPRVGVGQMRTWMQAMDNDVGGPAATDFMVAALGYDRRNGEELKAIKVLDATDRLPSMLAETLDDPTDPLCKNVLQDFTVNVEVKEIITKEKKQAFNLHTFSPSAEMRELADLRKAVEGGASIDAALAKIAA